MAKKAPSQKIRIRLSAYDYRVLDESTASIVSTVKGAGGDGLRSGAFAGAQAPL